MEHFSVTVLIRVIFGDLYCKISPIECCIVLVLLLGWYLLEEQGSKSVGDRLNRLQCIKHPSEIGISNGFVFVCKDLSYEKHGHHDTNQERPQNNW